MAKSNRSLKWIILLVVLLLLAGGGAAAYFYQKRDTGIVVQTEKVTRRNLTEIVTATGKIQPVLQVVINPEVSAEITELPVVEGQRVKKGDLLVKMKPDNYIASRNSAEASYKSSLASKAVSAANLEKAAAEMERYKGLSAQKLVSESEFQRVKTEFDVAKSQAESSLHQVEMSKASLARADEDLAKTTITAPINGTVTKLKSQKGERVVGTAMMAGTEIMTIADLDAMEARVDIGEMDIVLIEKGQTARLEVDAFRDRKFTGTVYELANAAKTSAAAGSQESIRFEVKIRVTDKEQFRPGMSVTALIETRYRTNALTVPIQSVTTRLPKDVAEEMKKAANKPPSFEQQDPAEKALEEKKKKDPARKPVEVVFLVENGAVKSQPVKRGISDDNYVEITEGLSEGLEVVSGSFKAINRELEDGKKIRFEAPKPAPGGTKP
jgi:HlyD family secretion protein